MTESMLPGESPSEALQSQLSAFVDDELPQAETELLTRRLVRESELQHAMGRYLLMGEALRSPSPVVRVPRNLATRIAAAITQDAAAAKSLPPSVAAAMARPAWLKPVAGMAVAASVMWVALVGVRSVQLQPANTAAVANSSSSAAVAAVAQLAGTHSAALSDSYIVPAVATGSSAPLPAARLTNYVVAHSEFTSPLGRRNMLTGLLAGDQGAVETVVEPGAGQ